MREGGRPIPMALSVRASMQRCQAGLWLLRPRVPSELCVVLPSSSYECWDLSPKRPLPPALPSPTVGCGVFRFMQVMTL